MAAIAAGLSLEGNMVFTYSIGNFATLRCIEQIRNDICYHNGNVKIIAVGCGMSYGTLGITHHATEDIAIMRALPNMKVYVPCDFISAEKIAEEICCVDTPCYVRLEKGKEDVVFGDNRNFDINEIQCLKKGQDVAILALGTLINEAIKAAEVLKSQDKEISVYSVLTLKPVDIDSVLKIALTHDYIITMEEHNIIGGLGSIICEIIAERNCNVKVIRRGLKDEFSSVVGSHQYLRKVYGLSSGAIVDTIKHEVYKNEM
ncbi:MAG: hypothetical protein LUH17_06480 [Acidaminococcaceae bacterium]|nr:hypothetical protein [Acidaminococcaceae bacterium]